ncbi:SUKH-4 family immunity protein [Actinomadura sp. NAK00032]|uniref:SUKH-4 family immunity protein n=1 Tax=Actinomadura sp. NAK00032 TaxID=2742128 RepID=UPI00159116DA|nr:SUKH-4 family immunity protein [Actinomadura sp. NAK00032]QKW39333.1 SUKH-4 family immunity protein [Actinomadura sp. NAK00032]
MTHEQLLETFGADGALRLPESGVAHEPTRRWLADVGLPRNAADLLLDAASGLRTAGDVSPKPLPEGVRTMLVLGTVTEQGGTVLLDGTTGEVFECFLGISDPELLAPDLPSLVRLCAAATRMHRDEGEFARFAGRHGPAVAADLTRLLLRVIRETDPRLLDVSDRISAHWRVVAHISPLGRVAGPGEGLALDLPEGLLAEALDKDDHCLYDDADLPGTLTHEPTRRFLREHGLADMNYCMWDRPALTLADYLRSQRDDYPDYIADYFHGHFLDDGETLPDSVGDLVRLGWVGDGIDLVLDGATGRVLGWFVAEARPHPINADISTVAFAQWLIRQVQLLDPVHDLIQAEAALVANLVRILGAADPVACRPLDGDDDRRYWPEMLEDGSAAGIF